MTPQRAAPADAPGGVTTLDSAGSAIPGTAAPDHDPIPILMYHVIADPPADAPYPELYVSGEDFARQIDWLEATASTL